MTVEGGTKHIYLLSVPRVCVRSHLGHLLPSCFTIDDSPTAYPALVFHVPHPPSNGDPVLQLVRLPYGSGPDFDSPTFVFCFRGTSGSVVDLYQDVSARCSLTFPKRLSWSSSVSLRATCGLTRRAVPESVRCSRVWSPRCLDSSS
jgi:hypothetical protein